MSTNPAPIAVSFVGTGLPLEFLGWPDTISWPRPATAQQLSLTFRNVNPDPVRVSKVDLAIPTAQLQYVKQADLVAAVDIPASQEGTVTVQLDFEPLPANVTLAGNLVFTTGPVPTP